MKLKKAGALGLSCVIALGSMAGCGYASALAVFLFLIIMLITALQMKLQKKWVNYE